MRRRLGVLKLARRGDPRKCTIPEILFCVYFVLSILSPGQGWYRSAKAQNSTKAPLTGNPNQLGPHMYCIVFWV